MSPERRKPPEQERQNDQEWLRENLHVLFPTALMGHEASGRGAILVDTTALVVEGNHAGYPIYYVTDEDILAANDTDALRMVRAYDPEREFVTILLKADDKESTYRIMIPGQPSKQ